MAVQQPGVWGIDLGQCALKAIRLELKDGQVVATAFDYIEHPKILSQPDADPDQLTREALEQFLSRNSLKGDQVYVSVPGQSGLARFVKLPPVEESKIADIVKFEAKQQIPFPLDEVVWDFQKLGSGMVTDGFALETEIGLFAMKREMVSRALQHFKDVNVEVHGIQMAPLSLCNFVAYDQLGKAAGEAGDEDADKRSCVVALDLGTDSSSLVITDGGKIIWQRPIPIGGNHFTRALTKDLKLTFAKAEHLKRNAAKSPDLKKILASLKSVLNDFVGEVQRSLGYFTNTHRDAQIQYMVGLGNAFRLPGLRQFLQEKLQLEVRKLSSFERLTGDAVTAAPPFTENILSFGVAYGLALQGLGQTKLQTNLLPQEVRTERLIRAKKPWAVAAAASLLLAVAGLSFFMSLAKAGVEGDDIQQALSRAKSVLDDASAQKKAYEEQLERRKKSEENLLRIGAGAKERLNWQLLHQYVNLALPMANGERLAVRSRDNVWVRRDLWEQNPAAQEAFRNLEDRRFRKSEEIADKQKAIEVDEKIKKNLIQINIAGISALYSDDLGGYFRAIHAAGGNLFGMDAAERRLVTQFVTEKDPAEREKLNLPKSGWVVEVRGYTYHQLGMKFVERTLLENLHMPVYLRAPNGSVLAQAPPDKKEMDDTIRKNIRFLYFYKDGEVKNPQPGKFKYIGRSDLRTLVKGLPEGGGAAGAGAVGMPPGADMMQGGPPPGIDGGSGTGGLGGAAAKPSRDAWQPIGEVASLVLGAGAGGQFGMVGAGPPGGEVDMQPPGIMPMGPGQPMGPGGKKGPANGQQFTPTSRYEFVLLFVWEEPQSLPQTDPALAGDPSAAPAEAAPAAAPIAGGT